MPSLSEQDRSRLAFLAASLVSCPSGADVLVRQARGGVDPTERPGLCAVIDALASAVRVPPRDLAGLRQLTRELIGGRYGDGGHAVVMAGMALARAFEVMVDGKR